ncbi:hypothetical protein BYT27DRAFT_7208950 [Phlegmacium glaucopus]|nr:hypothetical protein BYT27DRAFT_7208950 [Phlegmacium glaucopus]
MNNLLESLLKKERKDSSSFVPSSAVSGEVCEGSEGQQDTAQMTTFFQGAHHFVAHGPFTEIQGDHIVNIFYPPPRMAGEMLDADRILGNSQSRMSRNVDDVPKFNLFYNELFKTDKTSQGCQPSRPRGRPSKINPVTGDVKNVYKATEYYTPATRVRPSTAVLRRVKTVHGPLKHGREYSSFESRRVGIHHRETVPVNRPGRGRQIYHAEIVEDGKPVLWKKYDEHNMSAIKVVLLRLLQLQYSAPSLPGTVLGKINPWIQWAIYCFNRSFGSKDASASITDALVNLWIIHHDTGGGNLSVGEKRQFSHLRILLRLVAWNESMEFQAFEERISNLTELVAIQPQPLPFPQIREAVLSIKGAQHGTPFHPSIYWGVKLYDVGYVRGEEYVKPNYTPIVMEDEFITYPDVSAQMKIFDNGVSQLKYANFLGLLLSGSDLNFTTRALQLLTGVAIVKIWQISYGDKHQIQVSDLIMITGTIDHPSGSKIVFSDEAVAPMEHLYFYSLPPGSQPWGYWSADDRPTSPQDLEDTTISSVITPQIVNFIQLQEEDFQSDST